MPANSTEITVGERTFKVGPMRLSGQFQLQRWLSRQPRPVRPPLDYSPLREIFGAIDYSGLAPEDRARQLSEARSEAIEAAMQMARERRRED